MSMTKGTPASSQIVWLEGRVQELEAENERLKDANAQLQEIVNSDTAEEERIRAKNERLRAALDILQKAMTAKTPIPMAFKKAIIEARAVLEERP